MKINKIEPKIKDNLNLMYYLCQCSLELTPIEAFLYRELKSCPLKESAKIEVKKTKGFGFYQRKSILDAILFEQMRLQGLLEDVILYTPHLYQSSSAPTFAEMIELLEGVSDRKQTSLEACDLPDADSSLLTHRYNRVLGVVEPMASVGEDDTRSPIVPKHSS